MQQSEQIVTVNVEDITFHKPYYTRNESKSGAKAQEYALSIADGNFPPILVNQENILLDGWHRWQAHKIAELETIEVAVLNTESMDEFTIRRKAARNNSRHGQPQTESEIKKLIRDEYRNKVENLNNAERAGLKREMATDFSRSLRFVTDATSRIDKDLKKELRETAFQMWMACYNNQEIANEIGYTEKAIRELLESIRNRINGTDAENPDSSGNEALTNLQQSQEDEEEEGNSLGKYVIEKRDLHKAMHLDDQYKPPLYNVWKQQKKTDKVSHHGNSEITWLDNLLYLYTNPFDIVVDPFAGGGSTIDLCQKRLRRYLVSDRAPIEIRQEDIRKHDIKDGVLPPPQWKDVRLVYLDPPYWLQAKNQYSQDSEDLGNMELNEFNKALAGVIKQYAEKLKRARVKQSFISLIIQPTQWKAPDRQFTDHVGDMLRMVKLPVEMRYSVPYESQQYNSQMVDWAKENKKCLVLSREIIVWRV